MFSRFSKKNYPSSIKQVNIYYELDGEKYVCIRTVRDCSKSLRELEKIFIEQLREDLNRYDSTFYIKSCSTKHITGLGKFFYVLFNGGCVDGGKC